ncbi:MAG: very short patch repair endonuclease [Anaerolineales bacterium]|nr:very short patch repair endonuclease [Anaerolineales bacterium]
MASVRSSGTRLEERLTDALTKARVGRFERNPQNVEGRPDFVFRKRKVAVFVDSCFWHGCRWHCRMPASNRRYWNAKIQRNRTRDKQVTARLRRQGWIVMRIWEHVLGKDDGAEKAVKKIRQGLQAGG